MKRFWLIFLILAGVSVSASIVTLFVTPSPEKTIMGTWKETEWAYEKVNKINDTDKPEADNIINHDTRNLIIHEAESWCFMPGRKLKLTGRNFVEVVDWSIKGRGNILEIKHSSNIIEYYSITELNPVRMVLNFETDVQVRGIAKLTFEKSTY